MAKKSMILKQQAPAKFSTRQYNRCKICGRPHAYLRNYPASAKPAGKNFPPCIVSRACCIEIQLRAAHIA